MTSEPDVATEDQRDLELVARLSTTYGVLMQEIGKVIVGQHDVLTQMLTALRLCLPDAGLVLSTRESADLRDHLLPLGVTRLSAGSRTAPGAYVTPTDAEEQFEVQDERSLVEVREAVTAMGFDPVCKDWDASYH